MKYIVFAITVVIATSSCNNNPPKADNKLSPAADSTVGTAQSDFFPIPDYIGGQLKIIDSLKLPVSKTVTINNVPRLSESSLQELRELAQNFRQPDINDPAIKKQYTETSIADQSTPSVTLIFTTKDTSLPIQKIEVYVKPDPVNTDKVTGIYMEKIFSRNDTGFNQKLYWKTGKNMQVNTEKQVKGKTLPVEQIKLTWDY